MTPQIAEKIELIYNKQKARIAVQWDASESPTNLGEALNTLVEAEIKNDESVVQARIRSEISGLGPIDPLLDDAEVTEILVNHHAEIFYEKKGKLFKCHDRFFSKQSYAAALDRLSQSCGSYLNREKPFIETQLGRMRVTIIFGEISRGDSLLSIRIQPVQSWTLASLFEKKWCNEKQLKQIQEIFYSKKNFLVVGGTGSGKTSFLQSMLQLFADAERAVIIEDTQELHLPISASVSLLTRQDPSSSVPDITMDDLLKRALRLRPDRLVIGEIRGAEAKSLMMAMATGHDGSFGSLHARTAEEALIRLEMLIQMGAPQWSLQSIRKLIGMTVQNIIVVEKKDGVRRLQGIYEIASLENNGLTLNQIDESP
ncbi:MAG: CpaF family protein [Bdellovibrionaceae bacterium]|nr:CpaF family protein [Bdellovibrio sp.]